MSKVTEAVALARKIAADNTHGYDQAHRWNPDFDCSSLIITVWQSVGVPVKTAGATYTGNMRAAFLKCGFTDVTNRINLSTGYGLRAGDVLLNERSHAAMMVSTTRLVQASINEKGTVTGGKTGDQTGREIYEGNFYNFPWGVVLRFTKTDETQPVVTKTTDIPTVKRGSKGATVKAVQILLMGYGYPLEKWGADGDFGAETYAALLSYQNDHGLAASGEVNAATYASLLGVS